tara:strand:+ start:235 stop:501 length:267 start_codon:yes stop_codon:yes gene_type:complete
MDNRANNGGKREGAGRKPKAEEQKLIESLTPMNAVALEALETCVKDKQGWAVKLYFEYFYGKPQQKVDVTTNDESLNVPLINFINSES